MPDPSQSLRMLFCRWWGCVRARVRESRAFDRCKCAGAGNRCSCRAALRAGCPSSWADSHENTCTDVKTLGHGLPLFLSLSLSLSVSVSLPLDKPESYHLQHVLFCCWCSQMPIRRIPCSGSFAAGSLSSRSLCRWCFAEHVLCWCLAQRKKNNALPTGTHLLRFGG